MKKAIFIIVIFIVFLSSCGGQFNKNLPEYITDIIVNKESPDGIVVYLALADSHGRETTADGFITLGIFEIERDPRTGNDREKWVHQKTKFVLTKSFKKTTVKGQDSLKREMVIHNFGKIPYSEFSIPPTTSGSRGKIKAEFKMSEGKILSGETTFNF